MISDTENRRYLTKLVNHALSQDHARSASILAAIRDDYPSEDLQSTTIKNMRPWFESVIAQRKTVDEIADMLDVPRHRVLFALTELNLSARGMKA